MSGKPGAYYVAALAVPFAGGEKYVGCFKVYKARPPGFLHPGDIARGCAESDSPNALQALIDAEIAAEAAIGAGSAHRTESSWTPTMAAAL